MSVKVTAYAIAQTHKMLNHVVNYSPLHREIYVVRASLEGVPTVILAEPLRV